MFRRWNPTRSLPPDTPHARSDSLTNHHHREPNARAVTHEEHTHARVQRIHHHRRRNRTIRPRKETEQPFLIITDVGIKDGLMYAELLGGWADGYPGWIDDSLYVGEPKHVPTIGTFTLLDITTAQAVYGHGSATFCFEPDPDSKSPARSDP